MSESKPSLKRNDRGLRLFLLGKSWLRRSNKGAKLVTFLTIVAALLLVMGALASCDRDGVPADQTTEPDTSAPQPAATDTPKPPEATATPIPPPEPIVITDETDDALNCQTCVPVDGGTLPEVMDVTQVEVERVTEDGDCYFVFQIEYGRVETLDQPFVGGVEFLDPTRMIVVDFNWCFNSAGQWSFNFWHAPGQPLTVEWMYVDDQGVWTPGEDARFRGSIEGNVVTLYIPCDLVGEDFLWMVACTNQSFSVCDEVGMGEDRAASLELPAALP